MMPVCRLIALEGIDRLGKSTQTKLLVDHLKKSGNRVAVVKSPYNDGVTFPLIYWMLGNGLARKLPNAFQVVHFINKLAFQWFVLPRLRKENDFIIFDRWKTSMYAYGVCDGANKKFTELMLGAIRDAECTILFDGDPHITTKGDSYENDRLYQTKVRAFYLNWATWVQTYGVGLVDANQPVQKVFSDILQYLHASSMMEF